MNKKIKIAIIGVVGLIFGLLFYYPLLTFIIKPLIDTSPEKIIETTSDVLSSAKFRNTLNISFIQATLSALLSIIFAFPIAYLTSRYSFFLAKVLRAVSIIPFVLPSIIVIVSMLSLYGRAGLINRILGTEYRVLYGLTGIILSHVFYNVSIAYRFLEDGWNNIDVRYRQISKSLGEGKFRFIRKVVLPEMLPYLLSSFFIVFIYSFLSFAIVLVFGGFEYSTLEVELYNAFSIDTSGVTTSIYGLVQTIITLILIIALVVISNVKKRVRTRVVITKALPLKYGSIEQKIFIRLAVIIVLLFILLPLISLFVLSFENNGSFTFENYINLFSPKRVFMVRIDVFDVMLQSLSISIPAALITLILSMLVTLIIKGRRSNLLEVYMLIPIGISTVSLSYGVLYIFRDVFSPVIVIVLIHTILAFPIGLRMLKSYVDKLPELLIFIARSLGASRLYTFRTVELPMYAKGIANLLSYAVAISLSELTAVFVIGKGSIQTIPIAIYKYINNYQFGQALSLSSLYIVLLFIIFLLIDRSIIRYS